MKMVNHEYYVSLEVAKLLKEVGFDWKCKFYFSELINDPTKEAGIFDAATNKVYGRFDSTIPDIANPTNDDILRPTLDVAQRWLREVKGIEVNALCVYICNDKKYSYVVFKGRYNRELIEEGFDTYEDALEAGIKNALEIILKK